MANICTICKKVTIGFTSQKTNRSLNLIFRSITRPKIVDTKLLFSTSNIREKENDLEDGLKKNPYYEKYSKKIDTITESATQEYLKHLSVDGQIGSDKNNIMVNSSGELATNIDVSKHNLLMSPEKKLEKIIEINSLMDKTTEEISILWNAKHKDRNAVTAIIPSDIWETLSSRFLEHKTFLLPLPRNQGYEYFVVQFEGKEAHFTSLHNYQVYGENSPECLNLVYYTEILDDKDISLMLGEYDTNALTYGEASCLSVQLFLYYGVNSETKKLAHLERFSYNTEDFSHFDLIAELENSKNIPLPSMFKN